MRRWIRLGFGISFVTFISLTSARSLAQVDLPPDLSEPPTETAGGSAAQKPTPSIAPGKNDDGLTFDPNGETPPVTETEENKPAEIKVEAKPESPSLLKVEEDIKDISGLGQLAPFKDVAVIQRRFLPKTKRFEAFTSAGFILNQAFFINYSLGLRLGYNFSETYGLEAATLFLGSTEKQVTTDLREKLRIATRTLVTPKSYYGLDFKWTPIYGKMGLLNRKIVPFDMYYSGGGGVTQSDAGSAPTLHLGLGQIFALSKGMAVRWDMSWYFYRVNADSSGSGGGTFSDYHINLGMSFYFPGAKYR